MSNYHTFYCNDCAEQSEFSVNHGQERMVNFLAIPLHLIEITVLVLDSIDEEIPEWIMFRFSHRGHLVCVRNEYGEYFEPKP